MLAILTLLVTTLGTLLSFAVILTQFIGAQTATLEKLAVIQIASLMLAGSLALAIYYRQIKRNHHNTLKKLFITMPGWLIFVLLLLIITALLGDLSIFLVRLSGHSITSLFHIPSLCIIFFSLIYALLYFDFAHRKPPN